MRKFFCFIWLVCLTFSVGAQEVLSLDSCRALAIANNKELLISQEKINSAHYQRKAAFTNYLPDISATGTRQQAPQTDGRAGLPQLQQGLHVVDAQAVDAGQSLGQQAEQQGQGGARHCAQHGAHGLFPDAAYDGQAYHRHIGADDKRHQQRVGPLHRSYIFSTVSQ